MKNTSFLRNVLFTAVLSVMLIGCGGGKDYRNMLPNDSFMIMSMNLKSLREKANVGDPTQSAFHNQVQKMLDSQAQLSDSVRTYISSLMSNPSEAGLDDASDCFFFISMKENQANPEAGMLFRMKDIKKFEILADHIAQSGLEKKAENGFTALHISLGNATVMLAYNNEAAMLFISEGGYDVVSTRVTGLFNQRKGQSILANKAIVNTLDTQNDMCMMISYANLPNQAMKQMGSIPMMSAILKSTIVCPVNFEQGKIVAESKIYFPDSESEKLFMDNMDFVAKQNGNLLKFIPENSIATIGMNMKGGKMYGTLTSIPEYSQMVEALPQIKSVMEAIEGDVIISFNKMDAAGKVPEATLIAELNDAAAVQNAMGMLRGMPVAETAPYQYEFNMNGINASFGLQDKILYITTDPVAASAIKGGSIPSIEGRFGKAFNGSYSTFAIDFVALNAMLQTMIANGTVPQDVAQALPFIQIFDTLEAYSTTRSEGSMIVNMMDKDKNALDTIYHTIEAMIAMMPAEDACCSGAHDHAAE